MPKSSDRPPPGPQFVAELPEIEHRIVSPDGRWLAVTFLQTETRMGWYAARIALADARDRIVEPFDAVRAETTRPPAWSPDSEWLLFPARAGQAFVYIAWRVAASKFGLIRIDNPYPLELSFESAGSLRIAVRREQVEAANSDVVFGGGRCEAPVRRFRATPPTSVALAALALHPRSSLARIAKLAESAVHVELGLVPDGFHPYDGPGLKSTRQKINGRSLEGHHLEAFADHGDPVARAWLDELRQRMGDDYDCWAPVAKVLGTRKR